MDYSTAAGKSLTVSKFLEKYGHSALTLKSASNVVDAAGEFVSSGHGRKYSIAVVVDDNNKVVGVVSLGDIVFALYRHRERVFKLSVGAIMTAHIRSANLNEEILAVLKRMAEHDIRHMPVVENGELAGLVTRKDALEGLYDEAALELKYMTEFVFRSGARY